LYGGDAGWLAAEAPALQVASASSVEALAKADVRSGGSTPLFARACPRRDEQAPVSPYQDLKLASLPACSLLPSSLYLLCRAPRALHSWVP